MMRSPQTPLVLMVVCDSLSCPALFPSSPPNFPFSPPFQLHCSHSVTTLSIHNLSFSLLHLTSLLLSAHSLSPSPPSASRHHLNHSLSLPIEVEWDCQDNITLCGFHPLYLRRKLGISSGDDDPTVLYLHRHRSASLLPPVFTYEELLTATNRFDPRRKIGDGSVFLGQLYDGRIVAVKHLHRRSDAGNKSILAKSFCNEILILSSIEHPNLVRLRGYCSDTRGLVLVYDYVSNGTLFEHFHNRAFRRGAMTWQVRVEIALQIEYLHFTVLPPIVHRDITSSNIFLEKDMRIKVGDFGLSRLLVISEKNTEMGSDGCVWTGPQGTPGYLDPDYHRSFRLTEKSDVYSFGVVLLELVTGMKAVDQRREKQEVALAEMVVGRIQMGLLSQVVDPALVAAGGEATEGVGAVAELAFRCVAVDKEDRPDAREVVAELRRICLRIRGGGVSRGSNSMNVVVPDDGV